MVAKAATDALLRTNDDQIRQLKSLVEALRTEDYTKAQQVLRTQDLRRLQDKLPALQDCTVRLSLQLDDTEGLRKLVDTTTDSSLSRNDRLYILYRLEKYAQVLEALGADPDSVPTHLRAQSLFHMQRPAAAFGLYQELLSAVDGGPDPDGLRAQLHTNLRAAAAANAVPYCRSETEPPVDESMINGEVDLLMNHGILQAMMSNELASLRRAVDATKSSQTTVGLADKDIQRAQVALQCARDFWKGSSRRQPNISGSSEASCLFTILASVRQHNQALALVDAPLKALQELPPHHENWTLVQSRIAWYNQACLHLRAKQFAECRSIVQEALDAECFAAAIYPGNKKQQKPQKEPKKQPTAPQMTTEESLWWHSRLYVLLFYCDKAESASPPLAASTEDKLTDDRDFKQLTSQTLLRSTLERLQTLGASPTRDHSILYLLLHLGEPLTTDTVPVSLQSLTGLQWALQPHGPASGDWYMAHGEYTNAVSSYEQELLSDPSSSTQTQAKLVRALSFVDPDRAMTLWDALKNQARTDGSEELDAVTGADLEQQELPRLKSARQAAVPPAFAAMTASSRVETPNDGHARGKKSRGSVQRRRARQRLAHLDKLAAKGLYRQDRPVPPDPERWLPTYERSYNRKRRNKQPQQSHRGAQGGVSEQDTQKLDVVARQQAKASGDASGGGTSTAHLAVSGAGVPRKAGRKK